MASPGRHEVRPDLAQGGYVSVRVPASDASARLARQACHHLLPLVGDAGDELELLVSELVTNAVRHSGVEGDSTIWLEVAVGPSHIRLEVADEGPGFEPPSAADLELPRIGGFGLVFVNQLCDRWGVVQDSGTHVWAELPYRTRRWN